MARLFADRAFLRTASVLFAGVLVAGCGSMFVPEKPARIYPLKGIVPTLPAAQAPETAITDASTKRLALVISDSTEKQLAWLKTMQKGFKRNVLFAELSTFVDSKAIADQMVSVLKKRFADVALVDDFNAVAQQKLDYAAVVDIAVDYNVYDFGAITSDTKYDIQTLFLDPRARLVGTSKGTGVRQTKSYPCGMVPSLDCISKNRQWELGGSLADALQAWEADIGRVVR